MRSKYSLIEKKYQIWCYRTFYCHLLLFTAKKQCLYPEFSRIMYDILRSFYLLCLKYDDEWDLAYPLNFFSADSCLDRTIVL